MGKYLVVFVWKKMPRVEWLTRVCVSVQLNVSFYDLQEINERRQNQMSLVHFILFLTCMAARVIIFNDNEVAVMLNFCFVFVFIAC